MLGGEFIVFVLSVLHQRKLDILNKLTELRTKYSNSDELDEKGRANYLRELEFFATGVNTYIYSYEIVKKMSRTRLKSQYNNWIYGSIQKIRENDNNKDAYVRSWYTSGEIASESQVWLTLENGDIVDITGGQYKNQLGLLYYDVPVYVGKMDPFHSQFRLNGTSVEITPNDWIPVFLGESWNQRKKRRAYEIILKYIS